VLENKEEDDGQADGEGTQPPREKNNKTEVGNHKYIATYSETVLTLVMGGSFR